MDAVDERRELTLLDLREDTEGPFVRWPLRDVPPPLLTRRFALTELRPAPGVVGVRGSAPCAFAVPFAADLRLRLRSSLNHVRNAESKLARFRCWPPSLGEI